MKQDKVRQRLTFRQRKRFEEFLDQSAALAELTERLGALHPAVCEARAKVNNLRSEVQTYYDMIRHTHRN